VSSETLRADAGTIGNAADQVANAVPADHGLWRSAASQASLLLATGIAVGPSGLALLTPALLEVLQPLVAVTLVALGVIVAVESLASISLSKSIALLFSTIVVGGGLAAAFSHRDVSSALLSIGHGAAIASAFAAAGWVLASYGSDQNERRIFSIATFLLIGGTADYLGVPALLIGWIAAVAWRAVRPADLGAAYLDAAYVQGPAVALLLILTGAHVQFSWQIAAVALAMALVARLGQSLLRDTYGLAFGISLSPAALGAALLMDAVRLNPATVTLLSVAVLASFVVQLVPRRFERRG
jgi:hypothetical protein